MSIGPTGSLPAQRALVERFISWDQIRDRLARYEAIRRSFPPALLERRRNSPPYFCHYMAWRLGVWRNESLFVRLNELLRLAETLPNWAEERGVLQSPEYAEFWSLVWQLQVAEHLLTSGSEVRWCGSGPDLSVRLGDEVRFVECFSYRKSFGLLLFLEDVLSQVGTDIKLDHDWFMPFSLPAGSDRTQFLATALAPFLDQSLLDRLRVQARERYPVKVVEPGSTLVIFLEGPDDDAYDPSLLGRRTGDPEQHIEVILREAISAKTESNRLATHRPNLVAASYLLSTEAAAAFDLREGRGPIVLGPNIDALAISTIGIDARLSREDLLLVAQVPLASSELARISRVP